MHCDGATNCLPGCGRGCGDDDDDQGTGTPTAAAQEGDGSPEAQFFVQWLAIHKDVNDRIATNSAAYPGAFEGDLDDTKTSFPIYVDLFDEFRERVVELDIPSSLQAVVDEVVAADEAISAIHHQRADSWPTQPPMMRWIQSSPTRRNLPLPISGRWKRASPSRPRASSAG